MERGSEGIENGESEDGWLLGFGRPDFGGLCCS